MAIVAMPRGTQPVTNLYLNAGRFPAGLPLELTGRDVPNHRHSQEMGLPI